MKRILVTGGCGFIGSNFVRYLLARYPDCKVTNLDKLTYAGNPENLAGLEGDRRYRFVRGDVCDPQAVDPLVEEADAVVHFAAESHVDRSLIGGAEFVRTNVYGTAVLLEAARRYGVERFHQVGTDEVYGSVEEGAWTEESPVDPRNPYSASKASADILVRAYHVNHGLPAVITRASNNIGPYQYPEKRVPLYITNAIDDLPLPVYGDGRQCAGSDGSSRSTASRSASVTGHTPSFSQICRAIAASRASSCFAGSRSAAGPATVSSTARRRTASQPSTVGSRTGAASSRAISRAASSVPGAKAALSPRSASSRTAARLSGSAATRSSRSAAASPAALTAAKLTGVTAAKMPDSLRAASTERGLAARCAASTSIAVIGCAASSRASANRRAAPASFGAASCASPSRISA